VREEVKVYEEKRACTSIHDVHVARGVVRVSLEVFLPCRVTEGEIKIGAIVLVMHVEKITAGILEGVGAVGIAQGTLGKVAFR
jgi:hypothetical protein